jgi:hypothetical protein
MGSKFRKATVSLLLAGSAAVLLAPPAEANRGNPTPPTTEPGYVPPPQYGGNPHPDLPDEPDPYATPVVAPTVVPVDLPADVNPDPGAGLAGGGEQLAPMPSTDSDVQGRSETRPEVTAPPTGGGIFGGVLSRTGAETLPLARAGLAALTLGLGLVILARRRRTAAA